MTLLAVLGLAAVSLVGVFFFGKNGHLTGTQRYILPFTIGAFLTIVFVELIPETLQASANYGLYAVLAGYLLFYMLSIVLRTYHHHHNRNAAGDTCAADKATALLLLWGDAVHNVTDGMVIASAFLVNPTVGWVTTVGVALHEVPQEIAEFGVLRAAGYSTRKAVVFNFMSALGAVLGVLLSFFFMNFASAYTWVLTGVAAGNLLYIATSDLLPGVHRQAQKNNTFFTAFFMTLVGTLTMLGVIVLL